MWALLVVPVRPSRESGAGVVEIVEDRLVQQFVAHAAVERFADAVLHRLARRDEMPIDPVRLRPGQHRVGSELGSVVGDDQAWLAAPGDDGVEFARDAPAGDRSVGNRRQAFLGDVVDHVENAQAPPVRELVVDEVERPSGVGSGFDQDRRPRSRSRACGPCACEPSGPLRDRDAGSSCGSGHGPRREAGHAAAGSQTAAARPPVRAAAP